MSWDVICADSLRWMSDPTLTADHVITDPPYSCRTSRNARLDTAARRRIGFDGMDPAAIAKPMLDVSRGWVVAFCSMEQLGQYESVVGDKHWVRASAWTKPNPLPQLTGDRPAQAHEGIAIMHAGGAKKWNWGGRSFAPIGTMEDGLRIGHPTVKPLWLMLQVIEAFTKAGELILDPFCGSGTTGVACLRLGRNFVGIEKNPEWAELSCERLVAEERQQSLDSYRAGQLSMFDAASKMCDVEVQPRPRSENVGDSGSDEWQRRVCAAARNGDAEIQACAAENCRQTEEVGQVVSKEAWAQRGDYIPFE